MPIVLSEHVRAVQQGDSLSIREVAELFQVTRHRVVVALALAGVIPRKVARTYAVRREDLGLLRSQLENQNDEPVSVA